MNVLAERFHSVYGPAEQIHVLGGNATRCHGVVSTAQYMTPDSVHDIRLTVPVVIYPDDAAQQLVHMSGLVYASCFKLKHVAAPGQDPLARGWTRGGEIYLWVARGVKYEHDVSWPPVHAIQADAASSDRGSSSSPAQTMSASHMVTCSACMRKARGAKAARARLSVPSLPSNGWNRLYLVRHGQTEWNFDGRIQGRSDQPLNATGHQQASALATFLADLPLQKIISSDLQRAKATADAVAALHPRAERLVDARLTEMCFGSFEGKKQTKVKAEYRELLRAWKSGADALPSPGEGGESPKAVAARGFAVLRSLNLLSTGELDAFRREITNGHEASADEGDAEAAQLSEHGELGDFGSLSCEGGAACNMGVQSGSEKHGDGKHLCVVSHSRFNKILIAALRGDVSGAVDVSQGNACVNVIDFGVNGNSCVITRLNVCDHL